MDKKELIRKKYLFKRKKNFFQINENFFNPLKKLIKNKYKSKKLDISIFYPNNFEVNVLRILDIKYFKKFNFYLPVIEKNNTMNFYKWKKDEILFVNRFGVLEPNKLHKTVPMLILVPLLAFDINKNRLGYGKGFYDKYLNKYIKKHKKILTVGIAFSFQKYHKIPINNNDFKLDHILTDKGLI